MRDDGAFGALAGIAVIAVIIGGIYYAYQEQKEWDAWSGDHHCIVTKRTESQTVTGWYGGKYTSHTVPATTTYRCDDGVEYTR